jgi:FK506-binding protein 2
MIYKLTLLLILCASLCFADEASSETKKVKKPVTQLQIGIKKKVPAEKCSQRAAKGDLLHMHYTGTLYEDGSKFDSSVDRGTPFTFTLGTGQVIKGWDQGILGMCIGEHRRLVIPSDLGYGSRGSPPKIPANAPLVFEIELLKIERDGKTYEKEEL